MEDAFLENVPNQLENEAARAPENETPDVDENTCNLNYKLTQILCCVVCKELRRSSVFQCKYGHLICAGCFEDILAESKVQNEIATCPECQSTISKEACSQNVAVEKTISELPRFCPYCRTNVNPENYKQHQSMGCEKRPSICCNNTIGCGWEGPHSHKFQHEEECKQLSASGHDILQSLIAMDEEVKKEVTLYEQIFELLSVETFLHFDLQFKVMMTRITAEEVMRFFESSKFSALEHLFYLQGYFKEDISEFSYRLTLKNNCRNKKCLNFHYLLVKGPYSEMDIKPKLCQFICDEKASKASFHTLTSHHPESLKTYFSDFRNPAKRINFRVFLFLNKQL